MKPIAYLTLITLGIFNPFPEVAHAEKYSCFASYSAGEDTKSTFDLDSPSVIETVSMQPKGPVLRHEVLLAQDSICGIQHNLATDCQIQKKSKISGGWETISLLVQCNDSSIAVTVTNSTNKTEMISVDCTSTNPMSISRMNCGKVLE